MARSSYLAFRPQATSHQSSTYQFSRIFVFLNIYRFKQVQQPILLTPLFSRRELFKSLLHVKLSRPQEPSDISHSIFVITHYSTVPPIIARSPLTDRFPGKEMLAHNIEASSCDGSPFSPLGIYSPRSAHTALKSSKRCFWSGFRWPR